MQRRPRGAKHPLSSASITYVYTYKLGLVAFFVGKMSFKYFLTKEVPKVQLAFRFVFAFLKEIFSISAMTESVMCVFLQRL